MKEWPTFTAHYTLISVERKINIVLSFNHTDDWYITNLLLSREKSKPENGMNKRNNIMCTRGNILHEYISQCKK